MIKPVEKQTHSAQLISNQDKPHLNSTLGRIININGAALRTSLAMLQKVKSPLLSHKIVRMGAGLAAKIACNAMLRVKMK